jgi:hypothetical protein
MIHFNKILIAGVGSVGSFLTYHLIKSECANQILLYDPDIVEEKNIKNSIYEMDDIGYPKVFALRDKIDRNDIITSVKKESFLEGKTKIPDDVDLVVDCTDKFHKVRKIVDVKLYFSQSDYLSLDCRKNVKCDFPVVNNYSLKLNKEKIRYSIFTVCEKFFENGRIKELVSLNTEHTLDLNIFESEYYIEKHKLETFPGMIYDRHSDDDKILNFENYAYNILECNYKLPVELYLKVEDKIKNTTIIQPKQLRSISDLKIRILNLLDCEDGNYRYNVHKPSAMNEKYVVKVMPISISA